MRKVFVYHYDSQFIECKRFKFLVTYFVIFRRPWMATIELVFENPAALRGISNEALRIEESNGLSRLSAVFSCPFP